MEHVLVCDWFTDCNEPTHILRIKPTILSWFYPQITSKRSQVRRGLACSQGLGLLSQLLADIPTSQCRQDVNRQPRCKWVFDRKYGSVLLVRVEDWVDIRYSATVWRCGLRVINFRLMFALIKWSRETYCQYEYHYHSCSLYSLFT